MKRVTTLFLTFIFGMSTLASQSSDTAQYRVVIHEAAPYAFKTPAGKYEGDMLDLWRDVANALDLKFTLTSASLEEALNGVNNGTYDIAIGAITVTPEREKLVDFSHSITPSGSVVVVASDKVPNKFKTYYKPILASLLNIVLVLLAFMFLSAFFVWMVERKNRHHSHDRQIRHFGDGIWWSAVTISTVGYGDKIPHTTFGRVVGIIWIFIGVTMVSLFTANAAAILSKTEPQLTITENDLRSWEIGAMDNSSTAEYLQRENIRYETFDDLDVLVNALLDGKLDAIVGNVPTMKYLTSSHGEELIMAQEWLHFSYMAFAMKPSPMNQKINETLVHIISEKKWQERFFGHVRPQ